MGIGPVASTKKVMAKTGMKIEDFDIIEANEAFAAQSVAVGKELGIDVDKQLNPNGGAIALGHPVGASGCRILVTLLHEMQARGAKTGLATLASAVAWAAPPSLRSRINFINIRWGGRISIALVWF